MRRDFVMGGGRHNPADVASAPPNHLSSVVVCVGADATSAGLWRPPPITKSRRIGIQPL